MAKELKTVLSIDGGGIRGIIPAMILAEIEKRTLNRIRELINGNISEGEERTEDEKANLHIKVDQMVKTKGDKEFIPTAKLFNLIAGVSTGGILALGLTKPCDQEGTQAERGPRYTAEDLVGLYEEEGKRIFSRSVWHRIRSGWGVTEERYPAKGIEKVLQRYLGETLLSDALTEVLIPSYHLKGQRPDQKGGHPRFFKNRKAKKKSEAAKEDFTMRYVARATSAAPTYFEPFERLVDGGIFANNPAMCAYAEALHVWRNTDILLVSLGTGELTRRIQYERADGWGIIEWIRPLFRIIFDGASDTVNYQLEQLPLKAYYRFQPRLDNEGSDDMDDAGPTNLSALKRVTEAYITANDEDLNELCDLLSNQLLEQLTDNS